MEHDVLNGGQEGGQEEGSDQADQDTEGVQERSPQAESLSTDEIRALRGSGWDGDLDEMRCSRKLDV